MPSLARAKQRTKKGRPDHSAHSSVRAYILYRKVSIIERQEEKFFTKDHNALYIT